MGCYIDTYGSPVFPGIFIKNFNYIVIGYEKSGSLNNSSFSIHQEQFISKSGYCHFSINKFAISLSISKYLLEDSLAESSDNL